MTQRRERCRAAAAARSTRARDERGVGGDDHGVGAGVPHRQPREGGRRQLGRLDVTPLQAEGPAQADLGDRGVGVVGREPDQRLAIPARRAGRRLEHDRVAGLDEQRGGGRIVAGDTPAQVVADLFDVAVRASSALVGQRARDEAVEAAPSSRVGVGEEGVADDGMGEAIAVAIGDEDARPHEAIEGVLGPLVGHRRDDGERRQSIDADPTEQGDDGGDLPGIGAEREDPVQDGGGHPSRQGQLDGVVAVGPARWMGGHRVDQLGREERHPAGPRLQRVDERGGRHGAGARVGEGRELVAVERAEGDGKEVAGWRGLVGGRRTTCCRPPRRSARSRPRGPDAGAGGA